MNKFLAILVLATFLLACNSKEESPEFSGAELIDKAIAAHGGDLYKNATINFELNDYLFEFTRDGYNYNYKMWQDRDTVVIAAHTFNGGIEYTENDSVIDRGARLTNMFKNRINNIAYDFYIPYEFTTNDVIATYLTSEYLRQRLYHKVKISFKTPAGAEPDLRSYMLWIDAESFEVDFIGKENNPNSGKKQFSAAAYKRRVGGMLFSDFELYQTKGRNLDVSLDSLGIAYNMGLMQRRATTTYQDIEVTPLDKD